MKTSNAIIVLLSAALLVLLAANAKAQGMGEIRGIVTDSLTGKPMEGVSVSMIYKGYPQATITDTDGSYSFKPLEPGTYTLTFQVFGRKPFNAIGITVFAEGIKFHDQKVGSGIELPDIVVRPDNIDMKKPVNITTISAGEIGKLAGPRDIGGIVCGVAGVQPVDQKGRQLSIRGSRPDATQYIIDGVKVIGEPYVPQMGIEQVSVITGGLPAQYGDTTSGVIIITTKGMK